jgi:hypothetical protein
MARVFITLTGGKRKRISGRFHGNVTRGGKDFYGDNERLDVLRSLRALHEIRCYLNPEANERTARRSGGNR